jgi:hypothetical protein
VLERELGARGGVGVDHLPVPGWTAPRRSTTGTPRSSRASGDVLVLGPGDDAVEFEFGEERGERLLEVVLEVDEPPGLVRAAVVGDPEQAAAAVLRGTTRSTGARVWVRRLARVSSAANP